uniref:Zinc finger matrin-type protein CG9776 n=1 Tax=Cacopsylla melanoneura TaxID=428564 RepID=A0A8D8V6Z4_9HEMI
MHSKKVSPTDMGKYQKRKHRSVGPNVTINNIVTLDPEKYTRSSSTSKLSPDTDYDRAKFLVEERARYWRDLKILYSDYTLVKLKQKELIDSEDNYVNKHCIEETIKLSNTLKLKIQAKCKDIIFITNLCGNSEVNRVVQSLADGENIDSVLIKKQRSLSETRQAEERVRKRKASLSKTKVKTAKKRDDKDEEEVETKEEPVSFVPPKRKPSVNEPKFLDSELHWCQYCNVFPPTIKKYLQHLHEESHKKKIKELKINENPWHKCLPEEQAWRTDSTDAVHVKAFNFFVPANGWFCQLCRSWMGDIHCAATHLRSYVHNMNLKNFQEKFPLWKQGWLDERTKALEETFKVRKESSVDNVQQKRNEEESDSSDEEQSPTEPISRHRTSKSKMWVPNPKAFERVCNETNPPPATTATESSLTKLKIPKKDRPPFIGKMPLISSINKKIVVKELPQNTTEKIATSCAESDKLQKEQDALKEIIIRRNEEENDLKLKEFMKVANKIKKGSKKKKTDFETAMTTESYNATEFVPVVEHVDPIENLIGPPALVAQWEAEANYDYHMRQFLHYNMTSQMMQMQQPQTFLLDPYHAVALHNQQFFNSTHNMISNQYENFELISRDDEEVYSQYMDFQNSPSSSPCTKMFASSSKSTTDTAMTTKGGKDKKKQKVTEKSRGHDAESSDKFKTKQSVVESSIGKERIPTQTKDRTRLESKSTPKPKASHIIQKPACLNTPLASSTSHLMPSFIETFLTNNDNIIPSTGFISSLLPACADVKIVSTNELYKKKTQFGPSQRKKLRMKKLEYQNKVSGQDSSAEQPANPSTNLETSPKTENTSDMKNLIREKTNYDANMQRPSESAKPTTPKKNQSASQSLQDKINSIRKAINRNKQVDDNNETDLPAKQARREENISDSTSNVRIQGNERHLGRDYEDNRLRRNEEEEYEESEDDGDVEKLIYYDMTSI